MEPRDRPLTPAAAEAWIPRTCFKTGPPGRVGLELEFLVQHRHDPAALVPPHRQQSLLDALNALPLSGAITVEPGGQVELSGPPCDRLDLALACTAADLAALHRTAEAEGLVLQGIGRDPHRTPPRTLEHPRYAAMASYLAGWGPSGAAMMCATASVQVNLEAGTDPDDLRRRWLLLHGLRPVLVAAFAHSPLAGGTPTGWKSTRTKVWLDLDPARTRAPRPRPDEDPPTAWARWALDAPLLLARRDGPDWTAPPGLSFRRWLEQGRTALPGRPPATLDDLAYHLTTLFPPVRARGHLEVRYVDAQPGEYWQVPAAVLWALAEHPEAGRTALAAATGWARRRGEPRPDGDRLVRMAARHGPADPDLRRVAGTVLRTAAEALRGDPRTAAVADLVTDFHDRWTAVGRCPADDLLDALADTPDAPDTPADPTDDRAARGAARSLEEHAC